MKFFNTFPNSKLPKPSGVSESKEHCLSLVVEGRECLVVIETKPEFERSKHRYSTGTETFMVGVIINENRSCLPIP